MIRLRLATESDLPLMFDWRNNPLVFQGFYTQDKPLTWEEHVAWWKSRNRDWRTFIIMHEEPVGVVNVGQLDHWSPEVGYYIGLPSLWGKAIGREAVRLALEWIKYYGREYVHTTVLDVNVRSIRLLKSLGFEYLGHARPGESWYQKKLT